METRLRSALILRALGAVVCASLGLVHPANVSAADKLLVSGYFSDAVARFNSENDLFLGTLTGATLKGPQATIVGPDGLLYVADEENDRVVRFDPVTSSFVDVFVPTGSAGLDGPTGLAFSPAGDLYVASFNTDSILGYDGTTGAPLASPFVASGDGGLNGPDVGIIFGPDGNLYVPSFFNNRVLKYDGSTGASLGTFIAGLLTVLPQPRTIIFRPDGFVYISSDSGNKVMRFDASDGSSPTEFVASGSGGLSGASGMVFGGDGFLYVTSWRTDQVLRFNATTGAYVGVAVDSDDGVNGPTFVSLIEDPPPLTPATSEWGLAVLLLGVFAGGTHALRGKPRGLFRVTD